MGLVRKSKADRIKEMMAEGKKPSEIIREHPDLADGLDDLITSEAPRRRRRGSGPAATRSLAGSASSSLEAPSF